MNDTKLTLRQKAILTFLEKNPRISRLDIQKGISGQFLFAKITVIRDLNFLVKIGLVVGLGKGRGKIYKLSVEHPLLSYVDLRQYFSKDPDERKDIFKSFQFEIFRKLTNLLTDQEKKDIDGINNEYILRTKRIDETIYKKELERFIIELSWKSSKIEGNTYSLLETERLIKERVEAQGHSQEEAAMILNHKQAFDVILKHKESFRRLDIGDIESLHSILTKDLGISSGFRKNLVGITGTSYKPLDNEWQIREALEKTVKLVNEISHPFEKALITTAMIAYIQPFADGNKRTSRMIANAILMAFNYCPISYRGIDEIEYKEALILFFEKNNLYHFKRIFIDQFKFSAKTYFS